jgi:tetratricopeptide (TPR) repeat protein
MRARRLSRLVARVVVGCSAALAAAALAPDAAHAQRAKPTDAVATYSAQARAAYEAGDFRNAIALYEKAYGLEREPTLLFNLARCHEALGSLEDLRAAVARYLAYLDAAPRASDRAAIERRVDALRKQIAVMDAEQRRPAATPPARTAAPSPALAAAPAPQGGISPWPWVVCGAGAGGLVAGAVLGVLAVGARDDAQASPSGEEAMDLESRAGSLQTGANIAFVAGAALMVGGATWGVVEIASSPSRAPSSSGARAVVRLEIGGIALRGRF